MHLRTEIHTNNVARCTILFNRQLEQLEKDRKHEECMNAAAEKVVEKFRDLELDPASDLGLVTVSSKFRV